MTAVEWLVEQILNNKGARVISTSTFYIKDEVVNQAKEMEIKQSHEYAEFAIKCDRLNMKILNFDGYINLNTNK